MGNRKVNGTHESRFFVISPGRIILRVGFKGSYVIFAIRPWGGTVQTLDAQTGIKYPVTKRGRWRGGLLFLPESQGRSCRHGMQGAYQPLPGVQSFRVSLFSLPVHPLFLMEVYSGPVIQSCPPTLQSQAESGNFLANQSLPPFLLKALNLWKILIYNQQVAPKTLYPSAQQPSSTLSKTGKL